MQSKVVLSSGLTENKCYPQNVSFELRNSPVPALSLWRML